MLETNKLNEYLYEAHDETRSMFFWLNADNSWTVNVPNDNQQTRILADTFDEAEGIAFKVLELYPA